MQSVETIQINDDMPVTYCFIYNGHSYPFNFDLFKHYSNYMVKNQVQIEQNKCINIINDDEKKNIELSKEIIQDFIKFGQREQIQLSDTNAVKLNYLADKYGVTSLFNSTNDYIGNHQKDIALEMLLAHKNDAKYIQYENFISNDISHYVNDIRLLSLDFPIIHRIFKKIKTDQKIQNDEVIEFLFKCLDKYGRMASVLFEDIDFTNLKTEYLKRITDSTIFDFHFTNSTFAKSIYNIQNDILLSAEETKEKLREQEENNEKMRNKIGELNEITIGMKAEIEGLKQLLNEQKENMEKEINSIKEKYDSIIAEIQKQKQKIIIKFEHKDEKEFDGIFRYLTEKAGGNNIHDKGIINITSNSICPDKNDKYHPKNLINFIDHTIYESNGEKDAKICFDFKDNAVQISGYSIKSYNNGKNDAGHLRNWNIEVSNDGENWIVIDKRIDDPSLNGPVITKYFQVKDRIDSFYRFVQLHVTDISWKDGIYTVFFHFLEFYGKLKI